MVAPLDITDAVAILGDLLLGTAGVPREQAGDVNDDGSFDISDAVDLLLLPQIDSWELLERFPIR